MRSVHSPIRHVMLFIMILSLCVGLISFAVPASGIRSAKASYATQHPQSGIDEGHPRELPLNQVNPPPNDSRPDLADQAADQPQPRITTSGPVGTPTAVVLSTQLASVGTATSPSLNDWTPDLAEDFEAGLGQNWIALDQNADSLERTWGVDDLKASSGRQSVWVAAGGANSLDPEEYYYPLTSRIRSTILLAKAAGMSS